jgi:hypothetical protein
MISVIEVYFPIVHPEQKLDPVVFANDPIAQFVQTLAPETLLYFEMGQSTHGDVV